MRGVYYSYVLYFISDTHTLVVYLLYFATSCCVSVCMWLCVCVDSLHMRWATRSRFVGAVNGIFQHCEWTLEKKKEKKSRQLVKPFARHRNCAVGPVCDFYHCHACRSGLGLGTYILYLSYIHSHTYIHTQENLCIHVVYMLKYVCASFTVQVIMHGCFKLGVIDNINNTLMRQHTHTHEPEVTAVPPPAILQAFKTKVNGEWMKNQSVFAFTTFYNK